MAMGHELREERANMTISVKVDREAKTISWTSDRTATVAVARYGEMDQGILDRATVHGLVQRGTDAGAMGMDYWDGKDKPKRYALDSEKMARIVRVVNQLNEAKGWDGWELRPSSDPLARKSQAELEALIA